MGMLKEFREFALKGNVLDLAVGVIIGGAFGGIVNSLIADVIMPVVSFVTKGGVDFSQYKLVLRAADEAAKKAEIAVSFGKFITVAINFVILAFCIFMVVKAFNAARKRFEAEKPAPPPPGPTVDQKLLTEIRDLLARR